MIAHPWGQHEGPTVSQLGMQFAFKAEKDVSFYAPVISKVPGGIFDHSDANIAKLTRFLLSELGFSLMFSGFHVHPVGGAMRDIRHLDRECFL